MKLEELGYNSELEKCRNDNELNHFGVGRVILEHKDRYIVKTESEEFESELIGNLRFTASSQVDLPAVGDWVAISEYDENKALIHAVYPRKSLLERKAVGKHGEVQIIAANIDFGIIVQSVNRDYSINRLERYLAICNTAKIEPIIVLSKVDLIESSELTEILEQVNSRIKNTPIVAISNLSGAGIEEVRAKLVAGKTYCLLGSSGVGKSTLINKLSGNESMKTGEISENINRGKHITSHRELIVLESGILIDNPGMREVGITDSSGGLEMTFDKILHLAQGCKFNNCTHTNETGCAVIGSVENKELDADSYANFMKMEKERAYFESSAEEKKQKDKNLGKLIKQHKKNRRNTKF